MNTRQAILIGRYSARYSVRGGVGLVFLLLSLTFGLMVAHLMLQPVVMGAQQLEEHSRNLEPGQATRQMLDQIVTQARPAVAWVLSSGSDGADSAAARGWADYLLLDRPALLSAIFLILMWGWPFIVAFGAFDLYGGDIASRQLRYQLLRADRSSIFFGRLLGTVVTFVMVLFLLGITVALYMGLKLNVYGWGSLLGWTLYGTLAMVCVSLPFIALCAWISAAVGSSFASLTIVSIIIGGVPLVAMIGGFSFEKAKYVLYALPWGYQARLFHPEVGQVAAAVGGCLAMTGLFLWLGHRKFTTRDL